MATWRGFISYRGDVASCLDIVVVAASTQDESFFKLLQLEEIVA